MPKIRPVYHAGLWFILGIVGLLVIGLLFSPAPKSSSSSSNRGGGSSTSSTQGRVTVTEQDREAALQSLIRVNRALPTTGNKGTRKEDFHRAEIEAFAELEARERVKREEAQRRDAIKKGWR